MPAGKIYQTQSCCVAGCFILATLLAIDMPALLARSRCDGQKVWATTQNTEHGRHFVCCQNGTAKSLLMLCHTRVPHELGIVAHGFLSEFGPHIVCLGKQFLMSLLVMVVTKLRTNTYLPWRQGCRFPVTNHFGNRQASQPITMQKTTINVMLTLPVDCFTVSSCKDTTCTLSEEHLNLGSNQTRPISCLHVCNPVRCATRHCVTNRKTSIGGGKRKDGTTIRSSNALAAS